jgi:hypothetical protein
MTRAAKRLPAPPPPLVMVKEDLPGGELTPEAALRAIRRIYLDWKGRPHVCGNAFRRLHEVEEMLKRAGF